jgi:hypothetical protein
VYKYIYAIVLITIWIKKMHDISGSSYLRLQTKGKISRPVGSDKWNWCIWTRKMYDVSKQALRQSSGRLKGHYSVKADPYHYPDRKI